MAKEQTPTELELLKSTLAEIERLRGEARTIEVHSDVLLNSGASADSWNAAAYDLIHEAYGFALKLKIFLEPRELEFKTRIAKLEKEGEQK